MSLQLCDLSQRLPGTFRCAIVIHVVFFDDVIIATVQLQEATGYGLVISPILRKYPICSNEQRGHKVPK